jgi:putative transposase
MANHVHLILASSDEAGLGRAVGEAHRRYPTSSMPVGVGPAICPEPVLVGGDGRKPLIAAVRHVSLNPVRARLVRKAEDWAWSSVRAHLTRE